MSTKIIDNIEIASTGVVLVRYLVINEDGNTEYIRKSFEPGRYVQDQPQEIQDACSAAWTTEVFEAWDKRYLSQPEDPV